MMQGSMSGKLCLITGGTDGIGLATARELAARGARLLLVGKNPDKGAGAAAQIVAQAGQGSAEFLRADLSSQLEIRNLAQQIHSRTDRIDVLVNNAGAMFLKRQESADGIEMTFALNQLSYFLLTNLVLDLVAKAPQARIVNVSSDLHKGQQLDFDDLQMRNGYSGMKAYGKSKLANILFSNELARRLQAQGVAVNSLHPGYVNSSFGKNNGALMGGVMALSSKLFGISTEKGAQTSIYLASAPEAAAVSGKYFAHCREIRPSPESQSEDAAKRLWAECEKLTGVAP
ncbi:MAG: SDR family oxidoreductase [Alphaproteobacteria bacterium]